MFIQKIELTRIVQGNEIDGCNREAAEVSAVFQRAMFTNALL